MKKIVALLSVCILCACVPKDDTDSPYDRSGLMLLTDHKTGCQYLVRNGITPRLDRDGKQVCLPR